MELRRVSWLFTLVWLFIARYSLDISKKPIELGTVFVFSFKFEQLSVFLSIASLHESHARVCWKQKRNEIVFHEKLLARPQFVAESFHLSNVENIEKIHWTRSGKRESLLKSNQSFNFKNDL